MNGKVCLLLGLCVQYCCTAQINFPTASPDPPSGLGIGLTPSVAKAVYTSDTWTVRVAREVIRGPLMLVSLDGKTNSISSGVISAHRFVYYMSNSTVPTSNLVRQTTTISPPAVLTVLKDGTLVLGVQRDEYCIRFIGQDQEPVDIVATADGVSYEPVYAADDLLLVRSRDQKGVKQVFVVPLSEKAQAFTRRVLLTDETGRSTALPNSVRFERKGSSIRWQNAGKAHFFSIPESVSGKP